MRRGLRDRDRLRRADPDPGRCSGALLVPPVVEQLNNLINNLPAVRRRPAGPRREERPAAPAGGGLQHHRRAAEAGEHAARPGRRRRRDPVRHRPRARQLGLRRRVDPRAEPVHDRLGPQLARLARRAPGPGARGVDQAPVRPDRQRGRQLRRRRARPGARRGRPRLHRAADPRRPVRRLARRDHLPARPRAARRRDARRDPRRDHHAVQRLPDRHDHLGRSGRSSTSRSRTT